MSDPYMLVYVNDPGPFKQVKNKISTTKYNLLTFIPRFLFEQFRKYANVYFLCIALLQQIPDVSPTGRYTTLVPLCIILSISAIREIIEDLKRKHSDDTTNRKKVPAMYNEIWRICKWEDIRVGYVVRVLNDEYFPADLILLSSSEYTGTCYIETSNLDGETNLKVRQAINSTKSLTKQDHFSECSIVLEVGLPNKFLYDFVGNIQVNNEDGYPLGPNQLLLRGARLKNTKFIYGVVVYAGYDTKLMMNANTIPLKRSSVDRVVNKQVLMMFFLLIGLSWISALGSFFFNRSLVNRHWYIGFTEGNSYNNLLYSLLTFVILYNNLIPISLQVSLEMVKFIQAVYIGWDLDMYYHPTKTPATARTSNLNEELGQVKYIFSDKTGTLTCNIMTLKYCYTGGATYWEDFVESPEELEREDTEEEARAKATNIDNVSLGSIKSHLLMKEGRKQTKVTSDFLTMCAICHTVVPEVVGQEINYQASSPDERALVLGAKRVGFEFVKRRPDSVTIKVDGKEVVYKLLNIIEFSSTRKRMTAIFRDSKNNIKVMVKGADSVVLNLLGDSFKGLSAAVEERLVSFSNLGLRTLCFAQKQLENDEYETWNKKFKLANKAMKNREHEIEKTAELIEKNLTFVGISAIEDKLQEGVPETLNSLMEAGIKIWVLTGDKQETAINIGMSTKLLTPDLEIIRFNHRSLHDTKNSISSLKLKTPQVNMGYTQAFVIDGKTLAFAMTAECSKDFMSLATAAKVVICCRVSPSQKTEIVRLVKDTKKVITLAIGDGANDVGMIQEAHVGIGISGQEGLQAVCASDYSIAQFRHLQKLLLVHGHWNYDRVTKLILFSFYKNVCFYFCELWYALLSAFSGQIIFERWTIGLYNVLFTALPPLAMGIFDQVAPASTLLEEPRLYKLPQSKAMFNVKVFWLWCLNAIYVSLIVFWIPCGAMQHDNIFSDGKVTSLLYVGNVIYSIIILTMCFKALIEMSYWNRMVLLMTMGSMVVWLLFLPIYCNLWPTVKFAQNMVGMDYYLLSCPMFYLQLLMVPVAALFRDVACKIIYKNHFIFHKKSSKVSLNQKSSTEGESVLGDKYNQEMIMINKEARRIVASKSKETEGKSESSKSKKKTEPNSPASPKQPKPSKTAIA